MTAVLAGAAARPRRPLLLHGCTYHECLGHEAAIVCLAAHPDQHLAATVDEMGQALLWSLAPCALLQSLPPPQARLLLLALCVVPQ